MSAENPRSPHWISGPETKAELADHASAERFAHMTYGELVRHFGLGTTHTFSSWDQVPEEERAKWVAALSEVHAELVERQGLTSTRH